MPTGQVARILAALVAAAPAALAQGDLAPREVPARSLPVPADVSPQVQKLIAAPLRQGWNTPPTTPEGWRALAEAGAAATRQALPGMRERLGVGVEMAEMGGVKVFVVTPREIRPENRNRLLIHVHGGCYVLNQGEAGLPEGHCQVVQAMVALDRAARRNGGSRCHPHARLLAPDPEGLGAGTPIPGGGHQVPSRAEVAVDHGVG